MDDFERLLERDRLAVERYVRWRLSSPADADDVLQETWLAACQNFSAIRNREAFKPWLLSIARNKCADYFRRQAARWEIPLDTLSESRLQAGIHGLYETTAVQDTLEHLGDVDRQILYLCYWKELPQAEIAARLHIPLGTVKSRLHSARERFRSQYPAPAPMKGENTMNDMNKSALPGVLPGYTIEVSDEPPFPVLWEELMGWLLVPKPGEKLSWGMYDQPERKLTYWYDMAVTGRASVHGIEGVRLRAVGHGTDITGRSDPSDTGEETLFVAQLTDTHCRYLAVDRQEGDVRVLTTFLDGEAFTANWGYGEDNVGHETHLARRGLISRAGDVITLPPGEAVADVLDRCTVTIGGRAFDTVRLIDAGTYDDGNLAEQYIDAAGRTVLWRGFYRDDWNMGRYKTPWHERLPHSQRLEVNGQMYVHWYDCVSDYIFR